MASMMEYLRGCKEGQIVDAIYTLGVENLCGVSTINRGEVFEFLDMMDAWEIQDIFELVARVG